MASPTVSYMRSLSFATAAPHHSHSAWAAAATSVNAAARSQQLYLNNHHSINSHNTNIYTHHLHNFNSHHDRSYAHHLHQFHHQGGMVAYASDPMTTTTQIARSRPSSFASPAPSGAGGRRRSSSIRSRNPPPFIKFDPFADEPTNPEKSLTSSLVVQPKPVSAHNNSAASSPLYTIDIPAARTTELQRYAVRSPYSSSRRFSFPANDNRVGNSLGGGNILSPSESRAAILPPALTRPPPRSSPSPPPARRPLLSGPGTLGGPNVSKLVAGILLNRVSAGKPLRRRIPSFGEKRAYVKSSLSSVVSVGA